MAADNKRIGNFRLKGIRKAPAGLDALRVEVLELSREAQTTWSKAQQLLKDEKKTMEKKAKSS